MSLESSLEVEGGAEGHSVSETCVTQSIAPPAPMPATDNSLIHSNLLQQQSAMVQSPPTHYANQPGAVSESLSIEYPPGAQKPHRNSAFNYQATPQRQQSIPATEASILSNSDEPERSLTNDLFMDTEFIDPRNTVDNIANIFSLGITPSQTKGNSLLDINDLLTKGYTKGGPISHVTAMGWNVASHSESVHTPFSIHTDSQQSSSESVSVIPGKLTLQNHKSRFSVEPGRSNLALFKAAKPTSESLIDEIAIDDQTLEAFDNNLNPIQTNIASNIASNITSNNDNNFIDAEITPGRETKGMTTTTQGLDDRTTTPQQCRQTQDSEEGTELSENPPSPPDDITDELRQIPLIGQAAVLHNTLTGLGLTPGAALLDDNFMSPIVTRGGTKGGPTQTKKKYALPRIDMDDDEPSQTQPRSVHHSKTNTLGSDIAKSPQFSYNTPGANEEWLFAIRQQKRSQREPATSLSDNSPISSEEEAADVDPEHIRLALAEYDRKKGSNLRHWDREEEEQGACVPFSFSQLCHLL